MDNFTTLESIETATMQIGILPFFNNSIEGFSIEEHTPEYLWFNDEVDGPWEWKGPIIGNFKCAYGKLFGNKAGYINLDILPYLIRNRRNRYPIENFTETERLIYNTIVEHESVRSDVLKKLTGLGSKSKQQRGTNPIDIITNIPSKTKKAKEPKQESFDTAITHLQMGTWIICADFEYSYTKDGKRYGWGKAVYATPEAMYGEELVHQCNNMNPEDALYELCKQVSLNVHIVTGEHCTTDDVMNMISGQKMRKA